MILSKYDLTNKRPRLLRVTLFAATAAMVLVSVSCSMPNLEKPQCTDARLAVKRFYSFHFGNEMSASPENLKARASYLTPELFRELSSSGESPYDYFTATERYPKSFRIGTCSIESPERTELQVVLLWRDDNTSEQKEVRVETVRSGDNWLIQKVSK